MSNLDSADCKLAKSPGRAPIRSCNDLNLSTYENRIPLKLGQSKCS